MSFMKPEITAKGALYACDCAKFRRTTTVDDYLVPVDERWNEPERDIHETPLDCAVLQSEMLATLAQRDHARRRAAALTASRKRREG